MSGPTIVKRARRNRGGATPKGGRFAGVLLDPQEQALQLARRAAARSRTLLRPELKKVEGVRGKKARRATEKRKRQARTRQRRLSR